MYMYLGSCTYELLYLRHVVVVVYYYLLAVLMSYMPGLYRL